MSLASAQNSWVSSTGIVPISSSVLPYIESFKSSVGSVVYTALPTYPSSIDVFTPISVPIQPYVRNCLLECSVNLQTDTIATTKINLSLSVSGITEPYIFVCSLPPGALIIQTYTFSQLIPILANTAEPILITLSVGYNVNNAGTGGLGDSCYTLISYA